jgi:hypothetical protein
MNIIQTVKAFFFGETEGLSKLDQEIYLVSTALKRTQAYIADLDQEWAEQKMPCCPSCAFGSRYATLAEKAESQAEWLVALLRKRGKRSDLEKIERLTSDYSKAHEMDKRLRAKER